MLAILFVCVLGCSSSREDPVSIADRTERDTSYKPTHNLLGLWRFEGNRDAATLDITPLRSAGMHLNALPFLEPPPLVNLTLESLAFQGNMVLCDIGLRHPFQGLSEFTGFDVCGILISHGSTGGFDNPDLLFPGPDDLHLTNPDGYTRWWNPAEFPVNTGTMFCYTDGLLGTPDLVADFNATTNAYKYFCDELEPNDSLDEIDPAGRGVFSAGQKNIRRYKIDMGTAGLVFNYAVDASWVFPSGGPPYDVPDDFPPQANRPEPWGISVTVVENTLYNDGVELGGGLKLDIRVYDWLNPDQNTVRIESPGNFSLAESSSATGGGAGYSIYSLEITDATPAMSEIELLITAECEVSGYGNLLPGEPQAMYWFYTVPVSDEAPSPENPIIEKELTLPNLCDDIIIQGNYAYVVARYEGLHIINITMPSEAFLVNTVDTPNQASGIAVDGEYAYVADYNYGLRIIDINPPESAYIVNSVPTPAPVVQDGPKNVAVADGYAYLAHYSNGLQIVDVDPVGSAYLVNTVPISGAATDVGVIGDNAYITGSYGDLYIVDINPPGSASIIKTVDTATAWGIALDGGYAYVGNKPAGDVTIIDTDPIDTAFLVKTVDTPGYYVNLCISGDYAYVSGDNYPAGDGSLQILAINPPESAYIYSSINIPGRGTTVAVKDNYAFETTLNHGLQIIKLW